jgi:hypothetical protein
MGRVGPTGLINGTQSTRASHIPVRTTGAASVMDLTLQMSCSGQSATLCFSTTSRHASRSLYCAGRRSESTDQGPAFASSCERAVEERGSGTCASDDGVVTKRPTPTGYGAQ